SLYAQDPLQATLTAGLVVGGNSSLGGATVQGIAFNVSSPSQTFQNSELNVWGSSGESTHVLDSSFEGNWLVPNGLTAAKPDARAAQRLDFTDITAVALTASNKQVALPGAPVPVISTITDIAVDGVSGGTPGSSNGTAEAGVWIGQPVANGVHRLWIR